MSSKEIQQCLECHGIGCLACEDGVVEPPVPQKSQLVSTQQALKNLYNAVLKSKSVNDPFVTKAMEDAGCWF